MSTTHGQCTRCGQSNSFANLVCETCGSRLPWADAAISARRAAAPDTLPLPALGHIQGPPHPLLPPGAPYPTAVMPSGLVTSPAPVSSGQVFCTACGTANATSASFCSRCGQPLPVPGAYAPPGQAAAGGWAAPPPGAPYGSAYPPPNYTNINYSQNDGSGWIAALLIFLFAPGLGCLVLPVALVLLVFALPFAPLIVGVVIAVVISKSPMEQNTRTIAILATIFIALLINLGFFYSMPAHPTPHTVSVSTPSRSIP